jgi:hypothetical protein
MLTRFAVSLSALAAGLLAHQAMAADLKGIGGLKPEPDSALAELRGGFVTAGGVTFDIGITTSTYINGQLALRTSIATGPTAPTGPTGPTGPTAPTNGPPSGSPGTAVTISNTTAPPGGGGGAPPVTISNTTAPPGGGGGAPPVTTANTTAPPGGGGAPPVTVQTNAPPPGAGGSDPPVTPGTQTPGPLVQTSSGSGGTPGQTVTTTTTDGQTTVIQNPSQLINAVTNAADGQDIRLDTQVNVVLPGFDSVQRNQLLSGLGMKVSADGAFGIVSALPH